MLTASEAAMDAGDELHRLFPDIPDTALLDLLDLIQRESVRLKEAVERVAGNLSAMKERATAAREAMADVDSRLDRIERRLGIPEP